MYILMLLLSPVKEENMAAGGKKTVASILIVMYN